MLRDPTHAHTHKQIHTQKYAYRCIHREQYIKLHKSQSLHRHITIHSTKSWNNKLLYSYSPTIGAVQFVTLSVRLYTHHAPLFTLKYPESFLLEESSKESLNLPPCSNFRQRSTSDILRRSTNSCYPGRKFSISAEVSRSSSPYMRIHALYLKFLVR